jgi:MFS family permease
MMRRSSETDGGPLYDLVDKSSVNYLFYTLMGYNFIAGFYLSGITSLYPEMEKNLDLSNAILGDLIATSVLGIGLAIYFTPYMLVELGSANSTLYSTIIAAIGIIIYGFSSVFGEWMLILGINIVGFAFVWLIGSCNTQVSLLELVEGKPRFGFMQGAHALGILSGALIAAGLSELSLAVYGIDILFAILLLLVVLIPFPFYIRHDAEIRLELHREEVKDRVERERRRYLNNSMRNGSRNHSSSTSSSNSSDSDIDDQTKGQVVSKETNTTSGSDMEDSEGAFPSDSERDCFISDKEKRPLLRSRVGGNSSKNNPISSNTPNASSNPTSNSHDGNQVYGTVSRQNTQEKETHLRDEWTFLLLNLIMVCAGLGSGVAISWSQVYVLQDWSTSETVATLGYVGFQLGAAVSRFSSDYVFSHMTRKGLIAFGCIGAALGTFTSALSCLSRTDVTLSFAVTGFIITGFFFGPIYPAILSYATTLRGFPTGEAIPVVKASTLMAGMVIAPLFFGNVIDVIGYMSSFLIQAAVYVLGFVCAWALASDRHHSRSQFRVETGDRSLQTDSLLSVNVNSLWANELTQNNSSSDVIVMTSNTPVAANLAT